ncbi:MAG TPA: hypothetical protein VGE74_08965 [Gemmata sp.]
MWAGTTPVWANGTIEQLDPKTDRAKARNTPTAALTRKEKIPTYDLLAWVADRPELFSNAGTRPNAKGLSAMGEPVAVPVLKAPEGVK